MNMLLSSFYNRITSQIKFPLKRKACQVYKVGYGRGSIW